MESHARPRQVTADIPTIVCLCGSTKFRDQFHEANMIETMRGNIVLSVGFFMHMLPKDATISSTEKLKLDELHMRKIDLADEVLCINVNDYIGSSTKRELWYAQHMGKRLRFIEPTQVTVTSIKAWFPRLEDWEQARLEAART